MLARLLLFFPLVPVARQNPARFEIKSLWRLLSSWWDVMPERCSISCARSVWHMPRLFLRSSQPPTRKSGPADNTRSLLSVGIKDATDLLDKLFWVAPAKSGPTGTSFSSSCFRHGCSMARIRVCLYGADFQVPWTGWQKRISKEIRDLNFPMVAENPTWGAPRFMANFSCSGFDVSDRTVSRGSAKRREIPSLRNRWACVLAQPSKAIAAKMGLLHRPTITLRCALLLFVIGHDRRRILHLTSRAPDEPVGCPAAERSLPYESLPGFYL